MSGQRLEPDREAEIRAMVGSPDVQGDVHEECDGAVGDLLAELDAVRASLAACQERPAYGPASRWYELRERAERAEADLAQILGSEAAVVARQEWPVRPLQDAVNDPECSVCEGHEDDHAGCANAVQHFLRQLQDARERAEASLALVEGQAHRATADVLAFRRIATAAQELRSLLEAGVDYAVITGPRHRLADALAGWGDATRGAEDER